MSEEDKSVETIIKDKANKINNKKEYENHIKNVLKDHHIEISKEAVKVFKMGAVDAMIYDVGAALDSRYWKSRKQRRRMLDEIFFGK
jgi:hypothetical protein